MTTVSDLHHQAMNLVDQAMLERRLGKEKVAEELFMLATDKELAALKALEALEAMEERVQPSYSILQRSAASMAMNANRLDRAEGIINLALSQDPHPAIAEEMREVLEQVKFRNRLRGVGADIRSNCIQLDLLSAESTVDEYVPTREILGRLQNLEYLAARTIHRLEGLPFRRSGSRAFGIYQPMNIKVDTSASPLSAQLILGDQWHSSQFTGAIDAILDATDAFDRSGLKGLREQMPEIEYVNHFLWCVKRIAPDGERIREVALTSNTQNSRSVIITRTKSDISTLTVAEL